MAQRCYKAHTYDDEGAYCMRHDIESCDQGGEDQDKTWLDVKGKLEALERWTAWR